jgi:hypothetical protein
MNTTSQDRLTANRANAQKSTGPRTPEGRAASKMNAVKHGILSREVLVSGEDHQELTALQEWFQEELQPVGPMEVMLLGQIVATHWRLRRVLAAESGEIKREAELQQASAKPNALPPALEETAEGCRLVQTWLSESLLEIEQIGELTLGTVGQFSARVGDRSSSLKRDLLSFHIRQRVEEKRDRSEEGPQHEARKQAAMTFLQEKLRQLGVQEAKCQKKEEKEIKARRTYAVLPSAEALEKLGRYESMLNRHLFRAMKELRTLQKQRAEIGKVERNLETESGSENLPNEANGEKQTAEMGKAVGSSEAEGRNENLRNEPILAAQPSEICNLKSQMGGNLPNEATRLGS